MDVSLARLIEALLASARRRLSLILVPILVFAGFSILAATLWPRLYASTALLMLQEHGGRPLLGATVEANRELRLRADEIEALLKSERILASAIADLQGSSAPLSPAELDRAMRFWRSALTVKVVGSDFIEVEFKDDSPRGLARRLSAVITRFLESLLARQETLKTAGQFALEQRQLDVDRAQAELAAWKARHARPLASEQDVAAAPAESDKPAASTARFAASRGELESLAASVLRRAVPFEAIGQAISEARATLGQKPASGPSAQVDPKALDDLERRLQEEVALWRDAAQAPTGAAAKRGNQGDVARALQLEQSRLEQRVTETVNLLDFHRKLTLVRGQAGTPLGLTAPEQIRVIDEPRDPTGPSNSIVKVILMCLGAGIGLGLGLAALAEQLDDRIHDASDIETVTTAPLLARLPSIEMQEASLPPPRGGIATHPLLHTAERTQPSLSDRRSAA